MISSRVLRGDDTARPDIVYSYYVGDRQYTADRYDFLTGSNSDSTVPDVVARHPPGARFECFVDPADPSRAVINRTPTFWYYLGLAFFAAFAGIPGAIGLAVLYTGRRGQAARRAVAFPQAGGVVDSRFAGTFGAGDTGPIVLKPSTSPLGKLIAVTVICLFWNGLVGVFTYFEIRSFITGESVAWFMALFLLLFQAVGLGLLAAVPYQLLALANPRPIVTLSRGTVPLGGSVPFTWELSGAAHRVSALQIVLCGREEAKYRQGTDTQDRYAHLLHRDARRRHACDGHRARQRHHSRSGGLDAFVQRRPQQGDLDAAGDRDDCPVARHRRNLRPHGATRMSELRLELAGGRTTHRPGEPLSGRVTWRVERQPTAAELRLFWYTSGKGTEDVGVVETLSFAAPRPEDHRDFTLPLPREPYSFSGRLISLIWAIELIVEPGGHVERQEFVLSPTGKEVVP